MQSRLKGVPARKASHAPQQLLTCEQEDYLTDWIVDLDRQHNAPTPARVREMAKSILRSENIYRTVGKNGIQTSYNEIQLLSR